MDMGRTLVVVGLVLAAIGAVIWLLGGLGFGRLPGDLSWRRGNLHVSVPIASSIVLSIVLTIVLNLIARR